MPYGVGDNMQSFNSPTAFDSETLEKRQFFEKRQFYYLSPIQYIINKYIYPNKFDLRFKRYKYANS